MSITSATKVLYLLEANISGFTSRWILGSSVMGVGTILSDGPAPAVPLGSVTGLISGSIQRGRTDEFTPMAAGSMTILVDNAAGDFSPDNPSSIYYPNVVPNRQIRVSARYNPAAAWTPLFFGYVESYTPIANGSEDGDVRIVASDWLARANGAKVTTTFSREGDNTRVLNAIAVVGGDGLPGAYLGDINNQETVLPISYKDASGLTPINDVTQSTLGTFYQKADGTLTYRTRNGRWTYPGIFSANWFFDQPGINLDPRVIPYKDGSIGYSLDVRTIKTEMSVTASGVAGEAVATASDATAVTRYGRLTRQITAPVLAERCAGCMADALLDASKDAVARVTSIAIDCNASPTTNPWIDALLALDLGDTVAVYQRKPSNLNIARAMFIEGIKHDFDPFGNHTMTLQLSDQRLAGLRPWVIGQATLSNNTTLAY